MNITAELQALRDERYADFQRRLLPTLPSESIIGVRTPALRTLARRLAKEQEAEVFLTTLPHRTFEENQLHAFVIALERDFGRCVARIDAFLPYVDNWATCDQLSPACFARHHAELLPHIRRWMTSQHEYTVRFGIGMLLRHFLDADFQAEHLEWVLSAGEETFTEVRPYYIMMMQAWYLATALAKQWDITITFLEKNISGAVDRGRKAAGGEDRRPQAEDSLLPKALRKMTLRKAQESFRISDSRKEQLQQILKGL